ncbi:class I SAM-dependent methyltransferase [Methanoculleus sp. Wushi-C6]|uniref:Class I SAM-dependent methyltransferase n=1 Tax=Methanoculleus caldifontis TaxID=2651577 RepID=A0ABU3WY50_9EURY|nr:class I SAM-dependent methyltransferase [Methanoculleus sp. Wushi-C6]MDV2480708.1 class I SAM-dependent methyltransferase [Methanoculleus sp. Wushi-C6]
MVNNMGTTGTSRNQADPVCTYSFWHMIMLDNPFRLWLQSPKKILQGHIRPGMTVIDIGCGPGNFTRAMAEMAGERGSVIGVDLQAEMLRHAQEKCARDGPGARITWHQCLPESLGITADADFALSFYMVHEVPDQNRLFSEVFALLRPGSRYLVVEPVFHVTDEAFDETVRAAARAGFVVVERPALPLSRTMLLERPA